MPVRSFARTLQDAPLEWRQWRKLTELKKRMKVCETCSVFLSALTRGCFFDSFRLSCLLSLFWRFLDYLFRVHDLLCSLSEQVHLEKLNNRYPAILTPKVLQYFLGDHWNSVLVLFVWQIAQTFLGTLETWGLVDVPPQLPKLQSYA